ncbi:MAG: hypothetical protein QE267_05305 [Akkermansiaceae bacterium]|jgi:hypothetical protein|nr:hypothetical protein [Akkermansiaceae bacterium]
MKAHQFVSVSSVVLAGWLGATFLNEVPAQRYPKLDKRPETAASNNTADEPAFTTISSASDLPASVSR